MVQFDLSATSPQTILVTVWLAIVGLCFGSFLNVVIARLPMDDEVDEPDTDSWWEGWKATFRMSGRALKRLSWPPSRCPKCKYQLKWYDNVPVLSWLWLRGKCRSCREPISPRYILIELMTGALFVVASARYGFDWQLVSALTFFTFLIPLIFIDAEHWILPFELTLPGILGGVLLAIPQGPGALKNAALGVVVGFIAFRVMEFAGWLGTSRLVTDANGLTRRMGREALGAGDKYLLAMIGAQVGWRALFAVILFSSLQGAVVGIARLKLTGRAGPEEKPPEPEPAPPQPSPDGAPAPEEEDDTSDLFPFTPSFLAPGLPLWKRAVLVPVTIFFQDIPDSPPPDPSTGEQPEWQPQANNLPFGPWLGLAGLQVMLLSPWLLEKLMETPWRLVAEIVLGG